MFAGVGIKTADLTNSISVYSTTKHGNKLIKKVEKKVVCRKWEPLESEPFKARCLDWEFFGLRALRSLSKVWFTVDGMPLNKYRDVNEYRPVICKNRVQPDAPYSYPRKLSCISWQRIEYTFQKSLRLKFCKKWTDNYDDRVTYDDTDCENWVTGDWIPLNSTKKLWHSSDGIILDETYQRWLNVKGEPLELKDLDWFPKHLLQYSNDEYCLSINFYDTKPSFDFFYCKSHFGTYICEK